MIVWLLSHETLKGQDHFLPLACIRSSGNTGNVFSTECSFDNWGMAFIALGESFIVLRAFYPLCLIERLHLLFFLGNFLSVEVHDNDNSNSSSYCSLPNAQCLPCCVEHLAYPIPHSVQVNILILIFQMKKQKKVELLAPSHTDIWMWKVEVNAVLFCFVFPASEAFLTIMENWQFDIWKAHKKIYGLYLYTEQQYSSSILMKWLIHVCWCRKMPDFMIIRWRENQRFLQGISYWLSNLLNIWIYFEYEGF